MKKVKTLKKRWIHIVLLLFLAAGVAVPTIAGTYSYYTSSSDAQNRIITKGSGVYLQEVFNPDDLWLPGETKKKEVHFGNHSELDQVIRFKVTEAWYDNNGTPDDLSDDILLPATWWAGSYSPAPAVINWTTEITGGVEWVKIENWYYYTKILTKAGGGNPVTLPVINSVTFSNVISNAGPGALDDFSDKRYSLTIQMESLDVSTIMTTEAWGVAFSESGGRLTWT